MGYSIDVQFSHSQHERQIFLEEWNNVVAQVLTAMKLVSLPNNIPLRPPIATSQATTIVYQLFGGGKGPLICSVSYSKYAPLAFRLLA